jgi:hypothetical protein
MFGAWTTLPAGPAILAAKHGSAIVPFSINRLPDGTFRAAADEPILVPSNSPSDLAIATQKIATALEGHISPAPEQWYIFKPIWPETDAEQAALEARHRAAMANDASQLGLAQAPHGGAASGEMTDRASPTSGDRLLRRGLRRRIGDELTRFAQSAAMKLLLHLPERVVWPLAGLSGRISYRFSATRARTAPGATSAAWLSGWRPTTAATSGTDARPRTRQALERLVREPSATTPSTASNWRELPAATPAGSASA